MPQIEYPTHMLSLDITDPRDSEKHYTVPLESPMVPSIGMEMWLQAPWDLSTEELFVFRRIVWKNVGGYSVLFCQMEPSWSDRFPTQHQEELVANRLLQIERERPE
jgi:hypothetical protein